MNPYISYYQNQAGSGIAGFSGVRYQRGHGFFGKLFSGGVLPLLRYLGRQALSTGAEVAGDVLDGRNFKQAAATRLGQTGRHIIGDAITKTREYAQRGSGLKRKLVHHAGPIKKRRKRRKVARKPTPKRKTYKKATPRRRRKKKTPSYLI